MTIAAGLGNALIALNGATINVSGASDTFDILTDNIGQGLFTVQHVRNAGVERCGLDQPFGIDTSL